MCIVRVLGVEAELSLHFCFRRRWNDRQHKSPRKTMHADKRSLDLLRWKSQICKRGEAFIEGNNALKPHRPACSQHGWCMCISSSSAPSSCLGEASGYRALALMMDVAQDCTICSISRHIQPFYPTRRRAGECLRWRLTPTSAWHTSRAPQQHNECRST